MADKFTKAKIILFVVNICFVVLCMYVLGINNVDMREEILKSRLNGAIRGKYKDGKNHGRPNIITDNYPYGYPIDNYEVFEMIDSNDYIIKDTGSFVYKLIKGGDTITFYQMSNRNEIKK